MQLAYGAFTKNEDGRIGLRYISCQQHHRTGIKKKKSIRQFFHGALLTKKTPSIFETAVAAASSRLVNLGYQHDCINPVYFRSLLMNIYWKDPLKLINDTIKIAFTCFVSTFCSLNRRWFIDMLIQGKTLQIVF